MFVIDLSCRAGHVFEQWFERREDVDAALATLTCPTCGSADVERRPSFAAVVRGAPARRAPARTDDARGERDAARVPLDVQRALSRVLRAVRAHGEDVGPAFAETARAIHRGEQDARLIYGESTPAEDRALADEGVPFAKIPVPEIDEN
jgi:hypothetical protein